MTKDEAAQVAKNAGTVMKERAKVKAMDFLFGLLMSAILGLFLLAIEPVREKARAVWETPAVLQQTAQEMKVISDQTKSLEVEVRKLQRPDQVFLVSQFRTRPDEGFCIEGEECNITLTLKRDPYAIECKIAPGSAEFGFINPRSSIFHAAIRVDRPANRNIGFSWEAIPISIMTPTGLHPDADFTFRAKYTNCPGWEPGEEPLQYQSEPIPFDIITKE